MVGTITEIARADGFVSSITVRTEGGKEYTLVTPDEIAYGFDLNHMEEHRINGDPVSCKVEERDGRLVALTIDDVR
ncbi:MAG: hypothetical protein ABR583_00930 [Gaiellaceae bacterium]